MKEKKGFTLAELLIVVAIIAVLVAIGIPIFTTQLEKSREATDLANVRSAYAELMQEIIGTDIKTKSVTVPLKQTKEGWTTKTPISIAGIVYNGNETESWIGQPGNGGECTITYTVDGSPELVFNWSGGSSTAPTYTDSTDVQQAKMDSQEKANRYALELQQVIDRLSPNIKERLDGYNENSAYFTLSNGTKAWYKRTSDKIVTMEKENSGSTNSWINFTVDDNGKVVQYNYVDPNYSYSTYDIRKENPEWIGSGVIK